MMLINALSRYWGYEHDYRSSDVVVSMRDGGLVKMVAATFLPPTMFGVEQTKSESEHRLIVLDPFIPKVSLSGHCQRYLSTSHCHIMH